MPASAARTTGVPPISANGPPLAPLVPPPVPPVLPPVLPSPLNPPVRLPPCGGRRIPGVPAGSLPPGESNMPPISPVTSCTSPATSPTVSAVSPQSISETASPTLPKNPLPENISACGIDGAQVRNWVHASPVCTGDVGGPASWPNGSRLPAAGLPGAWRVGRVAPALHAGHARRSACSARC